MEANVVCPICKSLDLRDGVFNDTPLYFCNNCGIGFMYKLKDELVGSDVHVESNEE